MRKKTWRWRGFEVSVPLPTRPAPDPSRLSPEELIQDGPIPELRTVSRQESIKKFDEGINELRSYADARPEREAATSLADRVTAMYWYHTIELPGGVVTGGMNDHRALVPSYGIPDDLKGKRVLDVGTWDGFWAFEFERRGAEVKAVDLDRFSRVDVPAAYRRRIESSGFDYVYGEGFEVAKNALGSKVDRIERNIYDLNPDDLGTFDLVHVADVLLHLEFPTRALQAVRSVTGGQAMLIMTFDPDLEGAGGHVVRYLGGWADTIWWIPSLRTNAQMILDAGFSSVRLHKTYRLVSLDGGTPLWRAVFFAQP
ncbi:MAG: methyltransferase domain-containing protein [Actinomycetota bacterium]